MSGIIGCVLPREALVRSDSGPLQYVHTFIKDNQGDITEFYHMDKLLGKGAYGSAFRAMCRDTGVERAVKCMPLSRVKDPARFEVEINIARQLDHPNVVRLFETFRDEENIYLVMELCTGGELFERIMEEAPEGFDEAKAASFVRQILASLCYLHAHGFAHRDVKPENFLFQNPAKDSQLKLIDFGLACQFQRGQPMGTKVGTPYYVAPEVLQGCYDAKCDVWSAGVLCYILLCGYPPFHGESDKEVLRRVRRGSFCFPSQEWDSISDGAKSLIEELLTVDPRGRPTAAGALRSPWLQRSAREDALVAASSRIDFTDRLQEFYSQTRLKRVALTAIAQQLQDEDIGALQSAFRTLDRDCDGMLSYEEVREGLVNSGIPLPPSAVLEELLRSVDTKGSGCLDYTEFLAVCVDQQLYARPDVCYAAFRTFDLDGDGKISQDELGYVLGGGDAERSPSKRRIQRMVSEADTTGDGCIDFDEFCTMMRTVSPRKRTQAEQQQRSFNESELLCGGDAAGAGRAVKQSLLFGEEEAEEKKGEKGVASSPVEAWGGDYLDGFDVRSALVLER